MGRAHDTRRCAKRTCCRSGKRRFAACSGRNSTGILSIQAFYSTCVSTSGLITTRPAFFYFWKRPGGRLLPYFCSEKRPGYVANARGTLFQNCFVECPRGRLLRSLRFITIGMVEARSVNNVKNTTTQHHVCLQNILKKNQTTPRPSEHPPVMGGEMSKCLGGIKRLQIQNLFMAFKQVPRCR